MRSSSADDACAPEADAWAVAVAGAVPVMVVVVVMLYEVWKEMMCVCDWSFDHTSYHYMICNWLKTYSFQHKYKS